MPGRSADSPAFPPPPPPPLPHRQAIHAVETLLQAGGGALPVNVKVLFEGQEEIGSPQLEVRRARDLRDGT